ncbi:MAG: hypothetical protein HUJ25_03290 [Crocinitomicaceae bacterium]|nr:hypothetical protein [Crocinitomicaceae bacterium]
MKGKLFIAGIFIGVYTYVYLSSALVSATGDAKIMAKYWLNDLQVQLVLYSIIIVVPAHLYLAYVARKKHHMDWAVLIPFVVLPYMLGVTVQAMIL